MLAGVQVACGADHTLAVTSDNQLLSFGDNSLQQLGRKADEVRGADSRQADGENPESWVVRTAEGMALPVAKVCIPL